MSEINPRYPHWCKIIRHIDSDPLVDENGFSTIDEEKNENLEVLDDNFDPLGSDDVEAVNANEQEQPEEMSAEDTEKEEDSDKGSQTVVIYEGECRSYTINTTSDKGEIVTSMRGLALPLNQDGWDELGVVPKEGDEVVVKHGSTHEEYGRVVDKNVATAKFAGTHLTWRYGRN